MLDVLVAAPDLDAIAHFFTYLCRRAGGAKRSSTDRWSERAPTLQHRWPFFSASGLCLAFTPVSIPFQRLGMLRRVDGLAEEQCGDSLPPSKTRSTESQQSKSHHLSCMSGLINPFTLFLGSRSKAGFLDSANARGRVELYRFGWLVAVNSLKFLAYENGTVFSAKRLL